MALPDNTKLTLYVSGDEYYNWLHDIEGYTVMQGSDGYYYYAEKKGNDLSPSPYKAGSINPASLGIEKWLKRPRTPQASLQKKSRSATDKPVYAPYTGKLNNVVIFISFQDDPEFTTPRETFDQKFNGTSGPSLYHYFKEASYNKLQIGSSYFPDCALTTNLSYKDTKNRSYFQPYNATTNPTGYTPGNDAQVQQREHELLSRALKALQPEIEASLNALQLDADKDGYVDNVCFIIKGDCDGWSDLLWAHRWTLSSVDVRLNGVRVYDYVFQPENQVEVRTICHEMFHTLGAPDLYHYSYDGYTPVGIWDLMEDSDAHMSAYMKWKYSNKRWITDIPEISCSGTYTLNPLSSSTNNCYKIKAPGSSSEYFILEYRKKEGLYEGTLPGSGLLIYRINPSVSTGNKNGPPDEVYIFRPGGSPSNDGSIVQAHFSANEGRTTFNSTTSPYPFFSDGKGTELRISDIGAAENSISFCIEGMGCGDQIRKTNIIFRTDTVCQGEEIELYADLKDKTGPLTYAWNAIPSGSFLIYNGTTSSPRVPTNKLTAGVYRLKLMITDNGTQPVKTVTDTVSFVILGNPKFNITPHNGDFCLPNGAPDTTTLTIANEIGSNDPPLTYTWNCDRGQITSDPRQKRVKANVLLGCNIFTLNVTTAHGCSTTDTAELQGHHFKASISLKKQPQCWEYATLLTSAPHCPGCYCGECSRNCGTSPVFGVQWGPSTLISGNGTIATTKQKLWETITVWVALTDPARCVDTAWLTIPMSGCKEPVPTLKLNDLTLCDYEVPRQLSASYKEGIGPVTFTWTAPASWGSSTSSSITIPKGWSGCTNVTVKMTDHGLSTPQTISSTARICVYERPANFTLTPSKTETCVGDEVTLKSSVYGASGVTYTWTADGGTIKKDNKNGTAIGNVLKPHNVYTLTARQDRCTYEASTVVTGHEVHADISTLPEGFRCGAMFGTLTAAGSYCSQGDNIISYTWGPPSLLNTTTGTTVNTLPITGPTTFYLDVSDAFGCSEHTELIIGGGACETKVKGDTLCAYGGNNTKWTAHPKISIVGGNPKVVWHDLSGAGLKFNDTTSYTPSVDIKNLSPGDYPIEAIVNDGVTEVIYNTGIRIMNSPEVKLQAGISIACVGDSVKLQTTVTPRGQYTYYWMNGSFGKPTDTVGYAIPAKAGQSGFVVKIENPYGCVDYDTIKLNGLPRALLCGNAECTGAISYDGLISITNGIPPYTLYQDEALTIPVTDIKWTGTNIARIGGLQSGKNYRFYIGGGRLCTTSSVNVFQECDCYAGAFIDTDSLGCGSDADSAKIYIKAWGALSYSFNIKGPDGTTVKTVKRQPQGQWEYVVNRTAGGIYTITDFRGFTGIHDTVGCPGDVYGNAYMTFPDKLDFTVSTDRNNGCVGDTVTLTAQGLDTNVLHKWTISKGGMLLEPDSLKTRAILTAADNNFTFTANAGSGCTKEKNIEIKGHKVIAGKITTQPENGFACDESGTLIASGYKCCQDGCSLTYLWSPAQWLETTSGGSVKTKKLEGLTTFKVEIKDTLGCADSSKITINTGICEIKVQGDTLCLGVPAAHPSVTIKGGSPLLTWRDASGKGLIFDDPSTAFPTVNISGMPAGNYPVEIVVNDGRSVTVYTTSINIIKNPDVDLKASKATACVGETITLTSRTQPADPTYRYYWMKGAEGGEDSPTATATISKKENNTYLLKVENAAGCSGYDSVKVKGLEKAYLCAETQCINTNRYTTEISVLGGTPPYVVFTDAGLTSPAPHASWDKNKTNVTVGNLTSGTPYTFYITGNDLCEAAEVTVSAQCFCEGGDLVCDAGLLLSVDSLDCDSETDSIRIHIKTWGAGTYSFRLIAPNGSTVMTVTDETATEWTYPVARNQAGEYKIQDFSAFTEGVGQCPQKIYGTAKVIFPEKTTVEAGKDQYICAGQKATLTATGNAVGYIWDNGVKNTIPFTPARSQIYHVEGITLNGCKVKDSVWIYIEDPAKITWQSADVTIEKGQDATFEVQTTNGIPVSFKWERLSNGKWITLSDGGSAPRVAGSTTKYLALYNIPVSWKNNRLRCTATSKCGTDIAYFNIQVTGCVDAGNVTLSMEEGITPDEIPGDPIDGWYCRGVRIGVRATVSGIAIPKDLTYKWTVDGLPVNYSQTEYISWIPAMWEDDIVLKVCVYSQELCDTLCSTHIRLKSKAFEDASVRIATSIDPRRTFCKGEVITFTAIAQNAGKDPAFSWYNDIFSLGQGKSKTLTMKDDDIWIKLTMKTSDEICTANRLPGDTVFLKIKPEVKPTLHIRVAPDSIVCPGETITLRAEYTQAGKTPRFKWFAEIWEQGNASTLNYRIKDKDTWFLCQMYPSDDVCYNKDSVTAYTRISVLNNTMNVTITSDLKNRLPGEAVTFTAKVNNAQGKIHYQWLINGNKNFTDNPVFLYRTQEGDRIKCLVSGERNCQQETGSNTIAVTYASRSRDSLVKIYKGETIKDMDIAFPTDKNVLFKIEERALYGTGTLSYYGIFNYQPNKGYTGSDFVKYRVEDRSTHKLVAEGYIYITVLDNERYYVPNIITPDGDGKNDHWEISWINEYPGNIVQIYNRSGRIVYSTVNYQNDFNGHYYNEGKLLTLPDDIYTYVIELKNGVVLKSWLEIKRQKPIR